MGQPAGKLASTTKDGHGSGGTKLGYKGFSYKELLPTLRRVSGHPRRDPGNFRTLQ